VALVLERISATSAWARRPMSSVTSPNRASFAASPGSKASQIRISISGSFRTQSSVRTTTPERSFGSNQVLFGGMISPASAMAMSWATDTG